ncbi:MAG: acetyl-CoA carboxylase biotin carboxyl carrier protein [Planctomycetes bacterium]|nr:acetyl-CoA carboxylase biotin carboxyl carrier protein [Planctomycetota bacterium]
MERSADGGTPDRERSPVKSGRTGRRGNKLDLAELRRLAELMEQKDLFEVEIEEEGKRVHVVRGAPRGAATGPVVYAQAPQFMATSAPSGAAATAPAAGAPAVAPRGTEIASPMVGTFYRSPGPDAASFVEVGDRINKNSVVCIVEAMKVMNEIKAEVDGEILEILVQNGEPVEFGQPLFLVRPAGGPG